MEEGDTFLPRLSAGIQIAFEHKAHYGLAAFTELPHNLMGDQALTRVIFFRIVVGTIDHDRTGDAFPGDGGFSPRDMFLLVVRPSSSSTENDMAVGVAHGSDDRSLAVGIDADKVVRRAGRRHGVDRHVQAAFRAILEADRHRDSAGHFPVSLAFGRSGTDGGPTDEVGDILRTDRIQQLCSAGHAGLIDFQENVSRKLHAACDVAGAVEMGIVDQTLPSDRRPRLLKVCSHHDQQPVMEGIRQGLEPSGILVGGIRIMDRAGTDNDEQPFAILPVQDSTDRLPCFHDKRGGVIRDWQLRLDGARRGQGLDFYDVLIVDRSLHLEPFMY